MNETELQQQAERIKQEIAQIGIARPGTLYESYSICGKPGCRCARKKDPIKHGPYHYLSYTFEGRSHTEFVSRTRLAIVQEETANYERLMKLVKELVRTNIELSKLRRRSCNGILGQASTRT